MKTLIEKTNVKVMTIFVMIVLIAAACKKDVSPEKEVFNRTEVYNKATVENGYLHFASYTDFFDAVISMYNVNEETRMQKEKKLGFLSLKTVYVGFNKELDKLETLGKDEYFRGFELLKEKYAKQIGFSRDSYYLKCSGMVEASLANSEGIVSVGNDFLYFNEKSIQTFKNISYTELKTKLSNGQMPSTELVGVRSNPNSFSVVSSAFNIFTGNSGRAQLGVRAKLYNMHNSANGYAAYATYECNAQHKNIFGTWRNVRYLLSAGGNLNIGVIYGGNNSPMYTNVQISTAPGSVDEGSKEFVIAASKTLVANPSSALPQNGYIQFTNSGIAQVDDSFLKNDGYWESISSAAFGVPTISAQIIGGSLFSYPSVDFGTVFMNF
ncbi:hypothetical protein [Chitinophaga varians]|uniref:hypothetical protein n=1 Tax=Chitinophaga varians TaxID=2202339 RepID=UPI00165F53DA|nr:hypothetical protein [Chitinophaga varians]MBC9915630.1 hypothetical protein [Chitinophaga varians]